MTARLITAKRLSNGNLVVPFFCLAAVIVNQSVFRLGSLPLVWAALLGAIVAAVALAAPDFRIGAAQRDQFRWWNGAIGLLIVAPLIVTFSLGWNRDFPFSGDHYFHVGQAYRLAYWWLSPVASPVVRVPTLDDVRALLKYPAGLAVSRIILLAVLAAAVAFVYRRNRIAGLVIATLAIIGWGLSEQTIFVRYPAGGYLVAMPFLGPAFALHDVELAGRLANVLAPILWLFVLRPWLIGRWPDRRVLPFALLLFWHKDVIYYFDTVYVEAWAFTFCLLAIEILIDLGSIGAPLACLLVGAAATVKEPTILALPFVWLAGAPWRISRDEFWRLSGCGLSAGAPFVLYYVARRDVAADGLEISRGYHFVVPSGDLTPYLHEIVHRLAAAYSIANGLLFVAALCLLPVMVVCLPARRLPIACLSAAGILLTVFYWFDQNSIGWIGYFRFLLLALPFLAVGMLVVGRAREPAWALAAAGVALALQAPSAFDAATKAAGPITGLNFLEHYDAAIFFPMKSLIAEARAKGLIAAGATLQANAPDTTLRAIPGIPVSYDPPGMLVCECSPERPAVMALFVRYANLAAPYAKGPASAVPFGPPPERARMWRQAIAERPTCLVKLQHTCRHLLRHVEGGELVAILGTSD